MVASLKELKYLLITCEWGEQETRNLGTVCLQDFLAGLKCLCDWSPSVPQLLVSFPRRACFLTVILNVQCPLGGSLCVFLL